MKYLILVLLVIVGCGKQIPNIEITHPEPTSSPVAKAEPEKKESEPNRLTPTPVSVPAQDPVATPGPTVTPPIVTLSFDYLQSPEICTAITNWDPNTTTIVFVSSYSGLKHYVFSKDEIYLSNINGSSKQVLSAPLTISSAGYGTNRTQCCIDLVAGQLPRVRSLCQ